MGVTGEAWQGSEAAEGESCYSIPDTPCPLLECTACLYSETIESPSARMPVSLLHQRELQRLGHSRPPPLLQRTIEHTQCNSLVSMCCVVNSSALLQQARQTLLVAALFGASGSWGSRRDSRSNRLHRRCSLAIHELIGSDSAGRHQPLRAHAQRE